MKTRSMGLGGIPAMRLAGILLSLWIAAGGLSANTANSPPPVRCVFDRIDDHFAGSCGALFDQVTAMTLRPAAASSTGVWRDDIQPLSIWVGDMTDRGYPNAFLELDIYPGGESVLRAAYGWFAVKQFTSPSKLTFELETLWTCYRKRGPINNEFVVLSRERILGAGHDQSLRGRAAFRHVERAARVRAYLSALDGGQ